MLTEIGRGVMFMGQVLRTMVKKPWSQKLILEQVYLVATQAAVTTITAGFFVGALLTIEFADQLKLFGTTAVLGGLATSATIRELGPLLIAFMLAGKIGAYTAAELGTMCVTEQIDAMRCLGTDPIEYLIVPRFIGIVVSVLLLELVALFSAILGGTIVGQLVGELNWLEYLRAIPLYVTWPSVLSGTFKAFMCALVLAVICTYRGYATTGGAKGVGRAVLATALSSMVGIVVMDWFTSFLSRSFASFTGISL